MLTRWFKLPLPSTSDYGWLTWFNLVYLGFLFVPALFGLPTERWLAPTLLSVLLFLPAYLHAYTTARGRLPIALGIATLGFVLLPFNMFANTFVIYAVGILGLLEPARRGVLIALLVLVAFTAFALRVDHAIISMWVAWIVGMGVLVSNVLFLGHARKNQTLKLNQEEISALAQAAERERIARDLHDLLGHSLSVIALKSELARRLIERDPARAKIELEAIELAAREALSETRRAVVGMRTAGLKPELARARLVLEGAEIALEIDDQLAAPLPVSVETVLALAVREAVTNVLRHANATRVRIAIVSDPHDVRLTIDDDGRGIGSARGSGLNGMTERLAAHGGLLEVGRSPLGGARLGLRLPIADLSATEDRRMDESSLRHSR